ncbi:TIGR01777 family oxidoreductase [Halioxenophilus aromaticivorans]|uniref:TIGR01777 family oxidoreductase n=1 Tax=Halioxenophilus aromaticivorans TaxID=1306992 RepID=A0AAV3TZX3_9ALTE
MRIFVTGGTGLIGRYWISQRPQDQFTVLTRQAAPHSMPPNIDYVHDLSQLKSLNDYDLVLNLAGEPIVGKRWSPQRKQAIRSSRIDLTQKLVRLIQQSQRGPQRLISGSAVGIYGDTGSMAVNESTAIIEGGDDFAQALCRDWESEALSLADTRTVTVLRTGVVLSRAGGALPKMLPAFRFGLGGRIGHGQQMMSWIHIADMAGILNNIVDGEGINGVVNVTAPNPVTNAQFTRALAKACKRPAILPVPQWVLKLGLGQASQLLLDSQYVLPDRLVEQEFQFQYPTIESAFSDLI